MPYALTDSVQLLVTERGKAVHLHDRKVPVLKLHGILHRVQGPPLEFGHPQTLFGNFGPTAQFHAAARDGVAVFEHPLGHADFFRLMAFREDESLA